MRFYTTTNPDGTIHVQNAVAGMLGQHHVHTPEGYGRWCVGVDAKRTHEIPGECSCGLEPGQARDGRSGKVITLATEYQ